MSEALLAKTLARGALEPTRLSLSTASDADGAREVGNTEVKKDREVTGQVVGRETKDRVVKLEASMYVNSLRVARLKRVLCEQDGCDVRHVITMSLKICGGRLRAWVPLEHGNWVLAVHEVAVPSRHMGSTLGSGLGAAPWVVGVPPRRYWLLAIANWKMHEPCIWGLDQLVFPTPRPATVWE